jgi:hypothetical protein
MRVRELIPADLELLRAAAKQTGFPYPDPTSKELLGVWVVVDDDENIVCAGGAKKLAEAYFWCGSVKRPAAKMFALRLLHEHMATKLRQLGYTEIEATLPPPVAHRFAQRLLKSFGWTLNTWTSLNRRF